MCKIKPIILFLFITLSAFNQSNNIRFDHITTKDGLPHSVIFSIFQDARGFIWFGTNNGLARYDGYAFKNFQPEPDHPNSLSYKGVSHIFSDKQNNLWLILLNNGINRFNPSTEHFDAFIHNPSDRNSIPWTNIRSFLCDSKGTVWIGTDQGLYQFIPDKLMFHEVFAHLPETKNLTDKNIWDIKEDKVGNLWIGTSKGIWILDPLHSSVKKWKDYTSNTFTDFDSIGVHKILFDRQQNIWMVSKGHGVFRFDRKSKDLKLFHSATEKDNIPNSHVVDMFIHSSGDIFFYSDKPFNQVFVYSKGDGTFTKYRLTQSDIQTAYVFFAEDKDRDLWIGTLEGIYRYNPSSRIMQIIQNDPFDNGSLCGNHLSALMVDRNGILWVGVYKVGVDKVDLKNKMFRYYTKSNNSSSIGLPDNNIVPVLQDRLGNYWVGAHDYGMVQYNRNWKKLWQYPVDFQDPQKMNINTLGPVCEDKRGNIWVGSWSSQIDIIQPAKHTIRHLNSAAIGENFFRGRSIRQIITDKSGNIWITTGNVGIVEYLFDKQQFVYSSLQSKHDYKQGGFYRTIYFDKENKLWAGSQAGGLEFLDFKSNHFERFQNIPGNSQSISNNAVYCIYQENDSIYWVGTAGGLNRFNRLKKTFRVFTTRDGLCSNTIYSLLPDNLGKLWISTDMGLSRFDPVYKSFSNYFESDGLLGNEFNSNSYFKTRDEILFFGSSKGLISLNPNHIYTKSHKSLPVLTDLKIFNDIISVGDTVMGHVILTKILSETQALTMAWYHRVFTIEFSALHYSSTDKIKFEYKLENFDKKWVRTDFRHRSATYTNLPAGNYTFRLRSTNSNDVWCDVKDEVALHIIITPPFWNTYWFRILLIFAVLFLIVWYLQFRTRNLRKQKRLLALMVKDRTRELEDTNATLEEKQEEIYLQNEELQTQKEAMQEINSALHSKQEEIITQNRELDRHRNHLEQLVQERTKELEISRKKAEDSDRLKSAFLANMSHEIRTPMNAIVGFSSLLNSMDLSKEEIKRYTYYIQNNSNSLLVLIEEILDLSKIEANQLNIYKQQVIIPDLLKELSEAFTIQAQSKGITVILDLGSMTNDFACETDPFRLKQIINNLLNNALKFTSEGFIFFGISDFNEKLLTFFIRDTGIGISDKTGDSIFERFFKLEHHETQIYGGVGLGLAICRSLVHLLGGTIWYDSEEGKGAVFYFTIPCNYILQKEEWSIVEQAMVELPDLSDKLILIAEDEEDNFLLLSAFLSKFNVKVIGVKNGLEAFNYVSENSVDLILMDLKMPVMDGDTATRKIKQRNPSQVIVAQTAYALKEDRDKYQAAGFDGYIVKPINFNELTLLLYKVFSIKAKSK